MLGADWVSGKTDPAKPLLCKACGFRAAVIDTDPTPGKYFVELAWGRNLYKAPSATKSVLWEAFTGYKILIVDDFGIVKGDTKVTRAVKTTSKTCCDSLEYSATVQGDWPVGGSKFMIVPYQTVSDVVYTLPVGTMTVAFTDNAAGSATKVAGSIGMEVSDPQGFAQDPNAPNYCAEAIAAATAGVEKKDVAVTAIEVTNTTGGRRLGNARRLAGSVSIAYTIMLPSTYTGTFTKDSINPTTLKTAVEAGAVASGLTNFQVTSTPVVAEPVVTPVSGTTTGTEMGAARPMCGTTFSTLMMLAMALAGREFFA